MKLSIAFVAAVWADDLSSCTEDSIPDDTWISSCKPASGPRSLGSTDVDREGSRRYADLKAMGIKYWAKNGLRGKKNGFDERKYWAYGCHCMLLGDRPMSEMGSGKPKDELDNKCKAYKDCNKCVQEKHGADCIPEIVAYTWQWSKKQNGLISKDPAGSCSRELFECDKLMVENTFAAKDVFDPDFHAFGNGAGKPGFDNRDPANCPSGGTAPVKHECCGGGESFYTWMNTNKQECCTKDGQDVAVAIGSC